MQPAMHNSRFVHHMHGLSSDFSRYLSHSIKILPDALGHNVAHGACAAGLPGICNVNLVSDTMGDDIPPSARSRGLSKPEKPTQDTPASAECPVSATKSAYSGAHSAQIGQVSQWQTRPIGWLSRRRNQLLCSCLRLPTPAPVPSAHTGGWEPLVSLPHKNATENKKGSKTM